MSGSKLRIGPGVKVLDQQLRSIAEFESWKHSVMYNLRLDGDFKEYLGANYVFGKKTKAKPHRDVIPTRVDTPKSAEDKCAEIDFMLEQIAQFCPMIPHNDIIRDCGSLNEVWQVVRLHSNIETSGALLNDTWNISRSSDETPQALYSRLKQAYDDTLILKNTLIYKDAVLADDEELSPTLHCTIILHWLNLLHPKLRDLVTQRFGTELRKKTYAALFPEISRSVESMLRELNEDATVCRFGEMSFRSTRDYPSSSHARGSYPRSRGSYHSSQSTQPKCQCDYCRLQGRSSYNTHSIDDCLFLKREKPYSKGYSKSVGASESEDGFEDHYSEYYAEYPYADNRAIYTEHVINRFSVVASPVMTLFHKDEPYEFTLDSGGTCTVLPSVKANQMGCKVRPTYQGARMADGVTKLDVIGEIDVELFREGKCYKLNALVCNNMSDPTILAGMPFMEVNDIGIRPARAEIIVDGTEIIKYDTNRSGKPLSCRVSSYTLHSPTRSIIMPGESATFKLPSHVCKDESIAIEPRLDSSHNRLNISTWPKPMVQDVTDGKVSLVNTSDDPIIIRKHEQVCVVQTPVSEESLPKFPTTSPIQSIS